MFFTIANLRGIQLLRFIQGERDSIKVRMYENRVGWGFTAV